MRQTSLEHRIRLFQEIANAVIAFITVVVSVKIVLYFIIDLLMLVSAKLSRIAKIYFQNSLLLCFFE